MWTGPPPRGGRDRPARPPRRCGPSAGRGRRRRGTTRRPRPRARRTRRTASAGCPAEIPAICCMKSSSPPEIGRARTSPPRIPRLPPAKPSTADSRIVPQTRWDRLPPSAPTIAVWRRRSSNESVIELRTRTPPMPSVSSDTIVKIGRKFAVTTPINGGGSSASSTTTVGPSSSSSCRCRSAIRTPGSGSTYTRSTPSRRPSWRCASGRDQATTRPPFRPVELRQADGAGQRDPAEVGADRGVRSHLVEQRAADEGLLEGR